MHIRISRTKRNGKVYEYPQLVETYRRDGDRMPVQRVIGHLGGISAVELENLRVAIAAAREGQRVVVARSSTARAVARLPITANLRYLDLAVLLELWREYGLPALLAEVLPRSEATVPPAEVVTALALQRCVDPGSKFYATEWFPRSALPELLHVPCAQFNNTRVHRALDDLDAAGPALMAKLPQRYRTQEGAFTALFLDVTDTWFVGRGPTLAATGKTKEGRVERKIGIVLLCNDQGYPLRWEVVHGRAHDSVAMGAMLQAIRGLAWAATAPVVCDRAMGKTEHLVTMAATDLHFVTALTTPEFGTYAPKLPHKVFADQWPPYGAPAPDVRTAVATAATAASAAGLHKAEDNLYVLDLGAIERPLAPAADAPRTSDFAPAQAMRLGRQLHDAVAAGQQPSYAAAGRVLGLGKSAAIKYARLRQLAEDLQREILAGQADQCTLADLLAVAKLADHGEQRTRFAAVLTRRAQAGRRPRPAAPVADAPASAPVDTLKVRVVAYFNPERFVEQRQHAARILRDIDAAVAALNAKLARSTRSTPRSIDAAVDRLLRPHSLLEAFDVVVEQLPASSRFHVRLTRKELEWQRRRRYDGFTVLVAHPGLTHGAVDLCRLYRAKDVVEKDFEAIKSVVELRPVHHHDDAKVRAHVTLCMLALLMERVLGHRLGDRWTPQRAIALLEGSRLNRLRGSNETVYTVTEADAERRAILRRLGLLHLLDDDVVAERITDCPTPR